MIGLSHRSDTSTNGTRTSSAPTTGALQGGGSTPPARELLAVFVVVLAVYVAVTPRPHGFYHHHVYMAKAFLAGRVDLVGVPDHYHDVIRLNGKVYAPFQPLPAVLLMPLVAIKGDATHPGRFGQVLGALAAVILVGALGRMQRTRPVRIFTGLALGLGSVLWSATAIGSTWFFAHVVVVLMLTLVLWELTGSARGWLVGLWLSAAWLARATLLPAIPAVAVLLLLRHRAARPLVGYVLVSTAGLAVLGAYNYLRFGSPLEAGYEMLSLGLTNAIALAQTGYVGLVYVPRHLYVMLFRGPELLGSWPFLKPSPEGMALIFTSPIVVRLLFARAPLRRSLAWGLPIACIIAPMLIFFSTGWVQFGYRYSLDWWPFALVLLALALGERPAPVDWTLLAASVAMNGLGAYWVRTLGW